MGKKKNQKKGEEPSTTETGGEDQASTSKIDDQQDAPATEHVEGVPPKIVLYCEVCSFPPEYCEFGSSLSKCKKWLEDAHPGLFQLYYSDDALAAKASALSIEQANKLSAEAIKKESKAEQKAKAEEEKRKEMKILIKRVERTKRKFVTVIQGLDGFGVDLKAAAKFFAQKFATGASVTKSPPGSPCTEEIVIQGDVAYDVEELIEEVGGKKGGVLAGIDIDSVEVVEGKK